MRLRDYQNAAQRPKPSLRITARTAGASVVAVILVGAGTSLAIKSRSAVIPTDPATLCPITLPPTNVTVVLLDVSDRISQPQRIQIQNHLSRLRDSIPRFGLIEVYTLDRLRRQVTEPVIHVCNPGTGADLNRIYQNPELARKWWDGFARNLTLDIDRQISSPALSNSPIFEAIQATALRTFGNPEYDGLTKRLVVVSDLIHHVRGFSMYRGVPSFRKFRSWRYFSRVRSDLEGVSVLVYYLVRPAVKKQNRRHVAFWYAYFQEQGAEVEGLEKLFGDR